MIKRFVAPVIFAILALFGIKVYPEAITFGKGIYTNLCGSGLTARLHWCSRECKPETGVCQARWVQRTVCDGKVTECGERVNWGSNLSVAGTECGKTVVLNVFDHDCRENGWSCNDRNLRDYMVWYSGDCSASSGDSGSVGDQLATPSATLKPSPTLRPSATVTPTGVLEIIVTVTGEPVATPILTPTLTPTPTSKPVAPVTPETGGDIFWWTVGFVIAVEAGWIIKKLARKMWR